MTFIRHIFKGNDTAAIEAAISSGQLASPYIAFNVQSNTTNLVIPADKEPASIDYQQEEELWRAPYLVPGMYDDLPEGDYTDASQNFDFYYEVDPDSQEKCIRNVCFYLNSSYLEGWGSTEEYIETNTAVGSNTPLVFIIEKGGFDAAVEYWTSPNYGYSESKVLSMLAYNVFNGNETRYDNDGGNTTTWKYMMDDGSETSFWGEDIQYCMENSESINGNEMPPDESEYYIFVAYRNDSDYPYDAPEVLEASKDNILRAPVDYETIWKVYQVAEFTAYDYLEEDDDTPDASVYSTAEITSWAPDGQEWDDENYNHHTEYAATVHMENNDASMNYIQYAMCVQTDFDTSTGIPEGYNSLDDYYEAVCDGTYADTASIFNGLTEADWDATGYLTYDEYDVNNNGYSWRVVLRYVNGEVNQTEDEWGNTTEEFIVNSAKPFMIIGEAPMPEPEVLFDNFSDNGNGTTTFDAYLNAPADEQGYYYKAGRTSNAEWANIVSQDMMADWDEYIQTNCLGNTVYTGTEDNQDSITVTYDTNVADDGGIIVAMFDSEDNYITYFEVGQWGWPTE